MPSPRCRAKGRGWALQENGRNLYPLRSFPFDGGSMMKNLDSPRRMFVRTGQTPSALFPITPVALGRKGVLSSAKPGAVDPGVRHATRAEGQTRKPADPFLWLPFCPFWDLVEPIFPCERRQPAFSSHAGVCGGIRLG